MNSFDQTQHRRDTAPPRRITRQRILAFGLSVGLVLAAAACDTGDGKTLPEPDGTLPPPTVPPTSTELPRDGVGTLASVAIEPLPADAAGFAVVAPWFDGEGVEVINTCDGEDISPALSWSGVPDGTVELAVAMVDESVGGETPFVHWVMAGINPNEPGLIEGDTPAGSISGLNFFGNIGYNGPCPPAGDPDHLYRITVYALNQQVEFADGTPAEDLLGFIQAVTLESTDVTGAFQR